MLSLEVHFNIYPSITFVAKVSSYASFILPPNESDPFSCCESGHNGTSDCVVAVCVGFYIVFVGWVLCNVSGNHVLIGVVVRRGNGWEVPEPLW